MFALLPHKSRNSYDEMFVMIKDALADRGLALSAEYFMSDFEQNIVFPASSLKWNQRVCQETVPVFLESGITIYLMILRNIHLAK